ncbi:hypothetical protein PAHAL_1G257100 [Panicum hallii]|uniref:Uncharacterized protein n=1 Tax=Panicum hallii TaxID=206008 RepID=A0A2S3GQ07_9POAL|nr:hypothetical protein PAHAL_1G257100 [Panicum hallii]
MRLLFFLGVEKHTKNSISLGTNAFSRITKPNMATHRVVDGTLLANLCASWLASLRSGGRGGPCTPEIEA